MSTLTAPPATAESKSGITHFLFRRLHSLTGIIFGGYIVVHLLINTTLLQGGTLAAGTDVYQLQVDKIHSLPWLLVIEWTFIYIPIIFHTVYGIAIIFTGRPNTTRYNYGKNYFYLAQRISAIILVLFIAFHVLGMKGLLGGALTFDPHRATETTVRHITANGLVAYVIYPIGILAGTFHLANGFWTAAITWGLTVFKKAQQRWGLVCVGLFLLTFAAGMASWAAAISKGGVVVQ